MKKYNLGIIGAGMYGKVLMRCLQQDQRANITWINSASERTTKAAAEEFGVKVWTLDYREILADPTVDAVVISTPPYLHAKQLGAALPAGKHALIEKPLAEFAGKRQTNPCGGGTGTGTNCVGSVLSTYAVDTKVSVHQIHHRQRRAGTDLSHSP